MRSAVIYEKDTGRIISFRRGDINIAALEKKFRNFCVWDTDNVPRNARYVSLKDGMPTGFLSLPPQASYGHKFTKFSHLHTETVEEKPIPKNAFHFFRTAGIGDICMTLPSISAFRNKYKDIPIVYWTSQEGISIVSQFVDVVRIVDFQKSIGGMPELPERMRKEVGNLPAVNWASRSDLGIASTKTPKADMFLELMNQQLSENVSIPKNFTVPRLNVPDKAISWAKQLLLLNGLSPWDTLIGCQLDSSNECRRWNISKWTELALSRMDCKFLWFSQTKAYNKIDVPSNVLNTSCETTLDEFLALMSCCNAFVCTDTSGMHLAPMLGVPVVVLAGSTEPSLNTKYYEQRLIHPILSESKLPCQPCYDYQIRSDCYGKPGLPWCLNGDASSGGSGISVEQVWKKLLSILPKKNISPIGRISHITKEVTFLSSYNVPCGIAEYTAHLREFLPNTGIIDVASPTWFEEVSNCESSILHVQFEHGLYKDKNLADALGAYKSYRTDKSYILFTCHTYDELFLRLYGNLADFVIVPDKRHNIKTLKHAVIPLGCPVYEPGDKVEIRMRYGLPQDAFIISSFGFLSAWKQLDAIIESMCFNRDLFPRNVFFQWLHSVHPKNPNNDAIERVKFSIMKSGTENRSIFIYDFIPETEILERLSASDLGYLYAPKDTGSSSAAHKMFISARLPCVVSQISHYSDISDGGFFITPNDKFVSTLSEVSKNKEGMYLLRFAQEENFKKYNYRVIAEQHQNVYKELRT